MKISKTQVFISGSVIALSLLVSSPIMKANAQSRKMPAHAQMVRMANREHGGFQGSVSGTNGLSFTLEKATRAGTTTVNIVTTSATLFTKEAAPAHFSDLVSGEHVVVKGTKDINGVITASAVHIFTQIPAKHPSFRRMHNKKAL
jgi:hypothetical protein